MSFNKQATKLVEEEEYVEEGAVVKKEGCLKKGIWMKAMVEEDE